MKLLDYIKGLRKGKEAHRIEREAMRDPFLADALEGYDTIEDNHIHRIESLSKQIQINSKKDNKRVWQWTTAACILAIVSLGGYFLLTPDPSLPHETIALQESRVPEAESQVIEERNEFSPIEKEEPILAKAPEVIIPPVETQRKKATAPSMAEAEIIVSEELTVIEDMAEAAIEEKVMTRQAAAPARQQLRKQSSIKGKVIDEQGEALAGANIQIKGSAKGAITDIEGYFEFPADSSFKELIVDYIGFETLDIPVDTTQTMLIAMQETDDLLEESVVIAYGTAKKWFRKSKSSEPVSGKKAFKAYLKKNRIYPPVGNECYKKKGKVHLTFYVNQQGRPSDIQVEKGLCDFADQEAIRLIQEGPDWTIGDKQVKVSISF